MAHCQHCSALWLCVLLFVSFPHDILRRSVVCLANQSGDFATPRMLLCTRNDHTAQGVRAEEGAAQMSSWCLLAAQQLRTFHCQLRKDCFGHRCPHPLQNPHYVHADVVGREGLLVRHPPSAHSSDVLSLVCCFGTYREEDLEGWKKVVLLVIRYSHHCGFQVQLTFVRFSPLLLGLLPE